MRALAPLVIRKSRDLSFQNLRAGKSALYHLTLNRHFDYVAGECVKGITLASQKHSIPVGNGVLTVDTIEQAIERAGTKAGNKGEEAALAVVETVNLLRRID